MRGFVVPSSQCKRTSPMLIEDFVDELGNGNFDQFGQAGERDSSSFFSKPPLVIPNTHLTAQLVLNNYNLSHWIINLTVQQ